MGILTCDNPAKSISLMTTNSINNCTASAQHRMHLPIDMCLCNFVPFLLIHRMRYIVAFSVFVHRGFPRAAQWMIDLVTIDLGHVQFDGFSTFYCLRYAISSAGKMTCCGTAVRSLTGFSKRLID